MFYSQIQNYLQIGYSFNFVSRNPDIVNTDVLNASIPLQGEYSQLQLGVCSKLSVRIVNCIVSQISLLLCLASKTLAVLRSLILISISLQSTEECSSITHLVSLSIVAAQVSSSCSRNPMIFFSYQSPQVLLRQFLNHQSHYH